MQNMGIIIGRLSLFLSVALTIASHPILAEISEENTVKPKVGMFRVFLDVSTYEDYIKEHITYVDYVRDRERAQLHILMTRQDAGGDATEYTFTFTGLEDFSGINDTLTCITRDQDTEQYIRSEIVRVIKLGLVRYISRTPQARGIKITYQKGRSPFEETSTDRWDHWVFGISAGFNTSGQKSKSSREYSGSITADRVTSAYKFAFVLYTENRKSVYDTGEREVISKSEQNGFKALSVKSLGNHLSVGIYAELSSSVYYNIDMSASLEPAIEFSVFPYSQSTRRDFRFMYRLGYVFNKYEEETIYFVTQENLYQQVLSISLDVKENWGTIGSDLTGECYLHNCNLNKLTFRSSLSLRISYGLSVSLTGSYSAIHNQVKLPRRGATEEDILLKRQQLATQYIYGAYVGISYRFGSKYTNIVNPRF